MAAYTLAQHEYQVRNTDGSWPTATRQDNMTLLSDGRHRISGLTGDIPVGGLRVRVIAIGSNSPSDWLYNPVAFTGSTTVPTNRAAAYFARGQMPTDSTVYFPGTPQASTGAQRLAMLTDFDNALTAANITADDIAVWPFMGSTDLANSTNLLNPIDSDAAYRGVFMNGVQHGPLGITLSAGGGQYMKTFKYVRNLSQAAGYGLVVYTQQYIGGDNELFGAAWFEIPGDYTTYYIIDLIETNGGISLEDTGSGATAPAANGFISGVRQGATTGLLKVGGVLQTNNGLLSNNQIATAPADLMLTIGSRGGNGPYCNSTISLAANWLTSPSNAKLAAFEAAVANLMTAKKCNV